MNFSGFLMFFNKNYRKSHGFFMIEFDKLMKLMKVYTYKFQFLKLFLSEFLAIFFSVLNSLCIRLF